MQIVNLKKYFLIFFLSAFIMQASFVSAICSCQKVTVEDEEVITDQTEYLNDIVLKQKIGQMILLGFRGTDINDSYIKSAIVDYGVGGLVFFDYDVPTKSYNRNIETISQVKSLISDMKENSQIPLFISLDAEGGRVNRIKKFLEIDSAEEVAEKNSAISSYNRLSSFLKYLGFNLNLAPVVDLNTNRNNPIIGDRSFSSDWRKVVKNSYYFIKTHRRNNILTVLKHYPGHGSSNADSHKGLVDVTNTYSKKELYPYYIFSKYNLVDMVMTAHIFNKNIDSNYPATLSYKHINILRRFGFNGVIVTDDMHMKAIADYYGFEEGIIRSINAGCDIIAVSNNIDVYDNELHSKTFNAIYNAVIDGEISRERIDESYNRIMSLKNKHLK